MEGLLSPGPTPYSLFIFKFKVAVILGTHKKRLLIELGNFAFCIIVSADSTGSSTIRLFGSGVFFCFPGVVWVDIL